MSAFYLRLDGSDVVRGATSTPDPQPDDVVAAHGLVAVDQPTYEAGRTRLGLCRLVDGALQDCAPASVAPYTDPAVPAPVTGDAIIGAIPKADRAKCDPCDLARLAWRDDVPAANNKLGRIAKALGTTADALRQAAQQ